MKRIFITGANGFVGRHLCRYFDRNHIFYREGVRNQENTSQMAYGDFTSIDDWTDLLKGCEQVVHLANRAHVMQEDQQNPLKAFRKVNTEATFRFATACKALGIQRFVYLSSIKVNGEHTNHRKAFTADDSPSPQDPYAISKFEAEQKLLSLHQPDRFEVVIIRPPLIYGKHMKGNLKNLMSLLKKKIPLPFASVHNRRSLVSAYNLCDLIWTCLQRPESSGQIFLASDDCDISLPDLVRKLSALLQVPAFLFPFPVFIMRFFAALVGKSAYADRLFGDLQVDISKTKALLKWKPPYTFESTFSEK